MELNAGEVVMRLISSGYSYARCLTSLRLIFKERDFNSRVPEILNFGILNGFITARRLTFKIKEILNIDISKSSVQYYRHRILKMNFRRSRFQPKIFTEEEKVTRLLFAHNLKEMISNNPGFIQKLLLIDESTIRIGQLGIYHNRKPSSRPEVAGYQPHFFKNLNIWAGITSSRATAPIMFSQTFKKEAYEILIEEHLRPFIENHGECYVIQDNSPIHTSNLCKDSMVVNGVNLIRLPPYSPDINIMGLFRLLKFYA